MTLPQTLVALCLVVVGTLGALDDAQACACCSNNGQRDVGTAKIDATLREQIERLRFAAQARLYMGERDPSDLKGIAAPSGKYALSVARETKRWTFTFRDKVGHSGTLSLAIPDTVSIFAVDPRLDEREGTTGPTLFKEWKLTSNVTGTGIFAPGMGAGQRVTLILQAHGNNCTSADMATHWTLVVHGPKAEYHLFGKLLQ
jgi:hypothetical protein